MGLKKDLKGMAKYLLKLMKVIIPNTRNPKHSSMQWKNTRRHNIIKFLRSISKGKLLKVAQGWEWEVGRLTKRRKDLHLTTHQKEIKFSKQWNGILFKGQKENYHHTTTHSVPYWRQNRNVLRQSKAEKINFCRLN